MIIRKYILPTDLNRQRLRAYVFRFFREIKTKYQYVNIFLTIKGSVNCSLGNRVILNTDNKYEVRSFVEHLAEQLSLNKNTPKANDILYINFIETDKEAYNNYIAKISKFE